MHRCPGFIHRVLLLAMLSVMGHTASAAPVPPREGDLKLAHLMHRAFDASQLGTPGEIQAFAQTSDRILWLAGFKGLISFNGITWFANTRGDAAIRLAGITHMVVTDDDVVWVGLSSGSVARLADGEAKHYAMADGLHSGALQSLFRDASGTVWAANRGGLARFDGKQWIKETSPASISSDPVAGAFKDRNETLWVATRTGLHARFRGNATFTLVAKIPLNSQQRAEFTQTRDGSVWMVAGAGGLTRARQENSAVAVTRHFSNREFRTLLADRVGNLWLGGKGLQLLSATAIATGLPNDRVALDEFNAEDGLSGDEVIRIFEDRTGLLWVSTSAGLDRFYHSEIVGFALPRDMRGAKTLVGADDGSLWVADRHAKALIQLRGDEVIQRLNGHVFTSATRSRDGRLWLGGPQAVARIEGNDVAVFSLPRHVSGHRISAMATGADGYPWISVAETGLFKMAPAGNWLLHGGAEDLPTRDATALTTDKAGSLWVGYGDGRLLRLDSHATSATIADDRFAHGEITSLLAEGSRVWIGSVAGLALLDDGRLIEIKTINCPRFHAIVDMQISDTGDLWVYFGIYLARIRQLTIQQFLAGTVERIDCDVYKSNTVFAGNPQSAPGKVLVAAMDQRLWFTAAGKLAYKDLGKPVESPAPPEPVITAMSYGMENSEITRWAKVTSPSLTLPGGTYAVTFRFTAADFANPESLRFKVRLLGSDESWSYPTNTWGITYPSLSPGDYVFQVSSNNGHGTWSALTERRFNILPLFHQSWWFRMALALTFAGLLGWLFRFQLRRATDRVRARLNERLLERERIARELHDTLLQGFQGLILRFQGAISRLPPAEPVRATMDKLLDEADAVLIESRDRVSELRQAPYESGELPDAIADAARKLASEHGLETRLSVLGASRDIEVAVHAETFLIAREALSNAVRHAEATLLEVQLVYERNSLRLTIRDNGKGIENEVLRAGGRPGHWGLRGMRERAHRLRASLAVRKRLEGGTEIELKIPATVAYARSPGRDDTSNRDHPKE